MSAQLESRSILQSDSLNRIDGTWHLFSGDQLGSLFAGRALNLYQASGAPMSKEGPVLGSISADSSQIN